MTPPASIIPRKVTKGQLRSYWNDSRIRESIQRRTTQRVDVAVDLAPSSANQEEGALSCVYDFMDNATHTLLGTFHCYKNRDGSIGASGMLDPIFLLVDGIPLFDP